jgi:hypothetical protein
VWVGGEGESERVRVFIMRMRELPDTICGRRGAERARARECVFIMSLPATCRHDMRVKWASWQRALLGTHLHICSLYLNKRTNTDAEAAGRARGSPA